MSRGGSYGGGQSSLGYLFGSDEKPIAPLSLHKVEPPYGIETTSTDKPPAPDSSPSSAKQKPNSNNYQRAQGQNLGNFVTVSIYI